MKQRRSFLSSSIGLKFTMSLSGILLLGFVIIHMLGNLQVFLGPEAINRYAAFLQGLGELLWLARIALLVAFVLHIVTAVRLNVLNMSARPQGYAYKNTVQASIASRCMMGSGFLILVYVLWHLAHFTLGLFLPEFFHLTDPTDPLRKDVYLMVIRGFQNPVVSIGYILFMVAVGFHLSHGIASAVQTLGINHPRYFPSLQRAGFWLGILITIGYIAVPAAVLAGVIS